MKHSIKELKIKRKIAALTCDIEEDYGSRTGTIQWLSHDNETRRLSQMLKDNSVPLTGFVVCRLLENKKLVDTIQSICDEIESHSYSHVTDGNNEQIKNDIEKSVSLYESCFGRKPLGYRFPQGRFNYELIPVLKNLGLRYDSSIFPSVRPGVFNFSNLPQNPFYIDGLLELPFASFLRLRTILSISYLKLYGKFITRLKTQMLGLPNVLIIDSHMIDFICVESLKRLPLYMRIAYMRNKENGIELCDFLIKMLKGLGYEFLTVSQIYEHCVKEVS